MTVNSANAASINLHNIPRKKEILV